MVRHPIALPLVVALALLAGDALAIPIDFETVPNGAPADGLVISTQFQASHGITFELEGGGHPVLAQVGGAMTAFGGGRENDPDEPTAAAAPLIGQFFLTDDTVVGAPFPALIVRYDAAVSGASGILIDVDGWGQGAFYEAFRIEARGAGDVVLDTIDLIGAIEGDGEAAPWSFARALADILSIRIHYLGNKTEGIGVGFDGFDTVPEPGATVLVGLGLGLIAARRR
jgi:hypothetical protein